MVMSALEDEIIEKFRQLTPENRVRLLSTLQEEVTSQQVNLNDWLKQADAVRFIPRPDSNGHVPSASELVNEAREERDADILRSLGFRGSAGDSTN
jgi:hypothetical protein